MRVGDIMKNRKGFTLVEIIGVIAVLALIMLVTAPTLLKTLKGADAKEYETFVDNLFLATETHIQKNRDAYPQLENIGGTVQVSVQSLQESGYVKKNYENPKLEGPVNPQSQIKVTVQSDGTYKYEYIEG